MSFEVDIVSGKPKDLVQAEKKGERQAKNQRLQAVGEEIQKELKETQGKHFVKVIRGQLEIRIDSLVHNDPECKAYVSILNELGITLNVARLAAERLVREKIGK